MTFPRTPQAASVSRRLPCASPAPGQADSGFRARKSRCASSTNCSRCAPVGFYGYGEIARLAKDGISHYHNETFTTLLLGGRSEMSVESDQVAKLQKEIRALKKRWSGWNKPRNV